MNSQKYCKLGEGLEQVRARLDFAEGAVMCAIYANLVGESSNDSYSTVNQRWPFEIGKVSPKKF